VVNMGIELKQNKTRLGEVDNTVAVSIIVPAYNATDYLEKNVKTYLSQTLSNIEVIIVDDGSTDHTLQVAKTLQHYDKRVKVITKNNGGLSSARNAGVPVATGKYIFFIDPDDYMDDDTLEVLYESIEDTESDVAVIGYDLVYGNKRQKPGLWIQELFSESKRKMQLKDMPGILQASTAWGKLIRNSFYRENNLSFYDGILYEDQPFTAEMYAKATNGIDIVAEYKIHWVQRDTSISHQVTTEDLAARFNSAKLALANLESFSTIDVVQARLVQNLNNDFRYVLRQFDKVDDEYNGLLVREATEFYNKLNDKTKLDAVVDVAYGLLNKRDLDTFSSYLEATNISNYKMKIVNSSDVPVIDWTPFNYIGNFETEGKILPETFQPQAFISSYDVTENGPEISLQAYVSKISDKEFVYDVALRLVEVDELTGDEKQILRELKPKARVSMPDTIREHKEWWVDYSDNFYSFDLPNNFDKYNESVKLVAVIKVAGMIFEKDINSIRKNSTARWPNMTVSNREQYRLKYHKKGKFYYIKYVPIVTYKILETDGTKVRFEVESGSKLKYGRIQSHNNHSISVPLKLTRTRDDFTYETTVDFKWLILPNKLVRSLVPPKRKAFSDWSFSFFNVNDNEILSFSRNSEVTQVLGMNVYNTNYSRVESQFIVSPFLNIKRATVENGFINIDLYAYNFGVTHVDVGVTLSSNRAKKEIVINVDTTKLNKITIPLTFEKFGQEHELPLSQYTVRFKSVNGKNEKVVYDEKFITSLPTNLYEQGYHINRVDFDYSRNALRFQLFNLIKDDQKGGYGWSRMISNYLNGDQPADAKKVLFRTYYGETVTDNAVALTREILGRKNLNVDIYWAVQNQTIAVPDGTNRVIINSKEWFEILADAGTVVENVHQINYMHKKPGQRIVQAFHGYPYKQMGAEYYKEQEYSPARIKSFTKREADWDFILSPAPYASPLYQEAFNFKGAFLEVGHPRNDILVNSSLKEEKSSIREDLRNRLDIKPEQKVVLYAPTYRDYASDTEFKSQRVDFVDYDKLAKVLGEDYVLLLRGHMMNRRAGNAVSSTNIIDVTTYPEILDLIIASDMAVMDYSSLRFDYAQTEKPMIFLVPDLELYEETRGGLMPYKPTAPGRMVNNIDELVDAIKRADSYEEEYGETLKQFRTDYTPLDDGNAAKRMVDKLFEV